MRPIPLAFSTVTYSTILFGLILFFSACGTKEEPKIAMPENFKLFEKLNGQATGVNFRNQLTETPEFNYFRFDGIYQGAGLASGDFNNDGLEDLFFCGNMVPDRLFLNKGDLKFEDITEKAGVKGGQGWSTGASVADVNNDGFLDIYVCKFLYNDNNLRKNLLYINNGDLTFSEQGAEYKINDPGYSIHATFFDYDKDGYLDLYVANQPPNDIAAKELLKGRRDFQYTDHLFHNNGNGTFSNVTEKAGMTNFSYSLSATAGDLNNDGWPDLYVACDYEEPDFLYINNGDGTFTNMAHEMMRHMSNFSMGADIADINNDGWLDVYTADMVAADNERLKTNMSGMNPKKFWNLANNGYHYQYMFNALQLNNGNGTFSEIAQLGNVAHTDWSWAPVFADLDNDGYQDLLVTNGLYRDMRNNDFNIFRKNFMEEKLKEAEAKGLKNMTINALDLLQKAPSKPILNFIYKNNGDLSFSEKVDEWGFDYAGFSHGAIYADFDNDGDLDIAINNLNDEALIFKNKTADNNYHNFLRVKLEGNKPNTNGMGARITIHYGEDDLQVREINPVKGYMSTGQTIAHFGLGMTDKVDRVVVKWLDGTETVQQDIQANQLLTVKQSKASKTVSPSEPGSIFKEVSANSGIAFQHEENEYDDYAEEVLLPHRMSHLGPCMATGDVNKDGLEDVYIGAASGQAGALYTQQKDGKFTLHASSPWAQDLDSEDVGALFFDADGDEDLDLYVVSGGNDFPPQSPKLQDRLYLNDGSGSFSKSNALPNMPVSGSKVAAADYDGDGDLDLFVGGRQVPGKYGFPAKSYLLKNENGQFSDITAQSAPELEKPGMITDAKWMDIDKDGDQDLIVVGEWMPISFYLNDNGQLSNMTEQFGMEESTGWWNTIELADIDGDKDLDLICGNLGLNIKYKASKEEPFKLFVKDFDNNGTNDVYLGYYDSDGVCYPVRGRQCSSDQMPFIKKEFPSYAAFAKAPIENVLGERTEGALVHEVKEFASVWVENKDGAFEIHQLPNQAQIAPVFGIVSNDFNKDGHVDLLVAGNYYEREVETTRSDAGIGCLLLGDSKGNFEPVHPTQSGLKAYQDVRALAMVSTANDGKLILIANNNGPVQVYQQ